MTMDSPKYSANFRNLIKYFGFLMVFVYMGVGILLILPCLHIGFLNRNTRLISGIALILYGLFRAWRAFKDLKNENAD